MNDATAEAIIEAIEAYASRNGTAHGPEYVT